MLLVIRHERTGSVLGRCVIRRIQVEAHRPTDDDLQGAVANGKDSPLARSARHHAQERRRRPLPGGGRRGWLGARHADVVPAGQSAANPPPISQRREPVRSRPERYREIRLGIRQHRETLRRRGRGERRDDLGEPLHDSVAPKHAAVEQQRGRALFFRERAVAGQERGDMAGDGDIAFIRQAECDQAALAAFEAIPWRNPREKALEHDSLRLVPRDPRAPGVPHELRSRCRDTDGYTVGRVSAEEALLGLPTSQHELRESRGRENLFGVATQARLRRVREGEIHVVPTEQQVVPHRDPLDAQHLGRWAARNTNQR